MGVEPKMKKYDFYQKINARRMAIIRMIFLTVVTILFWYFLSQHIFALPALPRFMMIGIWLIGILMFSYSCIPDIKSGGHWLIYVRDGILHVDFPVSESSRSFEIKLDDITEIQENYTRTWEGGRSGGTRPTVLILTGSRNGHTLPEPQEVRIDKLLKTLKTLQPDLPHKIDGKIKDG